MHDLISGALTTGYAVSGLFFFRFWKNTRDRIFVLFAAAFWLLGAQRLALAVAVHAELETDWIYALRLLAFVVILAAIVDKNRASGREAQL